MLTGRFSMYTHTHTPKTPSVKGQKYVLGARTLTGSVDDEERRRLQEERTRYKARADILGEGRQAEEEGEGGGGGGEGGNWGSLWGDDGNDDEDEGDA